MKSDFTSSIYEAITVLLLVGYSFRSISLLIHLGDILALIPSIIQIIVFVFIFIKSQHLAYAMKLWGIYLIVSGSVSFISKMLLGISRDQYPEGIEWKALIMLSGVLLLWIAIKKVVIQKTNP